MTGQVTTHLAPPAPNVLTRSVGLVSPRLDGWLVGGVGIVAWVILTAPSWGIGSIGAATPGLLYWCCIAISGTHFGASYHLAYGQGRNVVSRSWWPLIAVPATLAGAALSVAFLATVGAEAAAESMVRALLAAVYALTGWHYVKQVYGVGRIGAAMRGLPIGSTATKVLRYGIYPIWAFDAVDLWIPGRAPVFDGLRVGYGFLPASILPLMTVLGVTSVVLVGVTLLSLSRRWGQLPPFVMWSPYAVTFLWFLMPPSHGSVVLVFGALHALQYLTCAHRAEMTWGVERGVTNRVTWWSAVFGGAFATGIMLVYWLPRALTDAAGATALGGLVAAIIFACFNLHHYAVDASIWRSKDQHVRRIVHGPARAESA